MGRTGTFITLDAMLERLKERGNLNIFEFVNEMRTRRMNMVQTLVRVDVYFFTKARSRNAYIIMFTSIMESINDMYIQWM